jgi:hypothetical protein
MVISSNWDLSEVFTVPFSWTIFDLSEARVKTSKPQDLESQFHRKFWEQEKSSRRTTAILASL